jgi:Protein of unknown function (DUF1203)
MEKTAMNFRIVALPSEEVRALQAGKPDAYGLPPERHISPGGAMPCRHCLADIAAGAPYLIVAHRPFPRPQPYAEQGPIFLHAEPCARYGEEADLPARYAKLNQILVKAYRADDRIYYGTGQIIAPAEIPGLAERLFADPDIAYIHARSATNNCYQFRIERGG